MALRGLAISLAFAFLLSGAAKKTTGTARGENEDLILNVTIYTDAAAVKEALGDDLGGHYIVAQVKVEPKYTKEIVIDRDDFLLRTDKDGDRSKPDELFATAAQLAVMFDALFPRQDPSPGGGVADGVRVEED